MIPQTVKAQVQLVHEHNVFVLSAPFAIVLSPLVMAVYITRRIKHKQQVLQQQIEQLEKLWNQTPHKKYS